MSRNAPRPIDLDLGTLALFVGNTLAEVSLAELRAQGHPHVRVSHGYVFQHLVERARTIGELAERLGVSQQAASKSVAELEGLGYVEREPDVEDARIHRVKLSKRGWAVIEAGRALRVKIARKLEARLGKARLEATRATLAEILETFDGAMSGAAAVRARRVRAPR